MHSPVVPDDLTLLLNNYHPMKKTDFRQFSHREKLATLTHLYLELRLPLAEARRAAKTDLQMDSQAAGLETTRLSGDDYADVPGLP